MDGRRFDGWTRRFAARQTRRGALRALLSLTAGAIAGRGAGPASAQQAGLPLGAPCATVDQCSQDGGPVVCADNGLARDGALNCCRNAGGACRSDAGCCAGLYCVDGACSATPGAPIASQTSNQISTRSAIPPGSSGGTAALGAPCTDASQCAASTAGTVVCGDSRVDRDRTRTCCLQDGGACGTTDAVCCGASMCDRGVCGPPQFGNQGPGDICQGTTDCSQALGPAACGDAAADGARRCCLLAATSCSTDDECCGGLVCAENGIASDGGRNCCGDSGAACASDASCCAYLFCIDGACGPIA
ncbi:MAG TPA: hypothetical protein VFI22_02955 [Thermomicrobiales bacterium]|nr:hypothetical protein [Thermomicrobiales bacterium]